LVFGLIIVVMSAGVGAYVALNGDGAVQAGGMASPDPTGTAPPATTTPPSPTASPTPTAPPTYPAKGPDTYAFAAGESGVFGTAGTLRRYRVAVEEGISVPVDEFAALVDATLGDPRSWTAGGTVRLQRVARTTQSNFTVYLMTPGTTQKHCNAGGFDIFWRGEPYTSCRIGAQVMINVARYVNGIPNYGAPLVEYRRYAINHEVGHALGHGHELCPGKGRPAPVMQQQTFSLQGCTAYAWPYRDGKRYAGPAGRIVPPG
jgi:hypothetical protein